MGRCYLKGLVGSSCGFVSDLASHNALHQPDA